MKSRKAINFDLSDEQLKIYYPNKNYKQAYSDIKRFMLKNEFEHRQYSGYVSKEPLSNLKIQFLVIKMTEKFPWLYYCVEKFDVTDISKQHSMIKTIEKTYNEIYNSEIDTKDYDDYEMDR